MLGQMFIALQTLRINCLTLTCPVRSDGMLLEWFAVEIVFEQNEYICNLRISANKIIDSIGSIPFHSLLPATSIYHYMLFVMLIYKIENA